MIENDLQEAREAEARAQREQADRAFAAAVANILDFVKRAVAQHAPADVTEPQHPAQ